MPRINSRGNHGGRKVEVQDFSTGTAADNYVPASQATGKAAWEAQAGGSGGSGSIVGHIMRIVQPASSYATEDIRPGGSSPAENFPVHDFDGTTQEYIDLYCVLLPTYAGGGLTIKFRASATSATSGTFVFEVAIRRMADDADDIDASHTYDYNDSGAITTASLAGEPKYFNVTFTDGSDMDSLAAGEPFILRVRRDPADANDTIGTDIELWTWSTLITET